MSSSKTESLAGVFESGDDPSLEAVVDSLRRLGIDPRSVDLRFDRDGWPGVVRDWEPLASPRARLSTGAPEDDEQPDAESHALLPAIFQALTLVDAELTAGRLYAVGIPLEREAAQTILQALGLPGPWHGQELAILDLILSRRRGLLNRSRLELVLNRIAIHCLSEDPAHEQPRLELLDPVQTRGWTHHALGRSGVQLGHDFVLGSEVRVEGLDWILEIRSEPGEEERRPICEDVIHRACHLVVPAEMTVRIRWLNMPLLRLGETGLGKASLAPSPAFRGSHGP